MTVILGFEVAGFLALAINLTALLLLGALLAAVWRLILGPSLADRVVALDLISMLLVVFLTLFAMASGVRAYIYAAIALALIAFLATVAFARYIERAQEKSDD